MTAKLDRVLLNRAVWLAAILFALALQTALIFSHEPWLDEYQAVQLAVQAPDFPSLLAWLKYEGHPPLWYAILRGMAHFMDPLATLPVAALLIAMPTQAAILFASPFSRAERLMIALSEFVMFEFLTLSRSMTLGVALFVLVLTCWRRRWAWLAIAILPFCDFLFGVLSVVCVLLKYREKSLWWPGVALWLASGLVSAWTVLPAPDALPALATNGIGKDLFSWLMFIGTLAFPFQGGLDPGWDQPPFPIAGLLGPAFLWFAWRQTASNHFHRLLMFGFLGLTLAFSLVVYPLAIRHLMLAALLLIGLAWLRADTGERLSAGFRLWLALAAACGVATAAINLLLPFDTAQAAVNEIERRGLAGKHWMVFPDSRAQGVAAISGMEFERTKRMCMQSFIRWDYNAGLRNPQMVEDYLRDAVRTHGRFYLIGDIDLSKRLPPELVMPIAHIPAGYDRFAFHLFVIGPSSPERQITLPRCVPDQRPFARL
ncbi:MAG: hypothetical protein J7496_00075 [Novosphingobium sp.]|nr:hypothetical protein [Novosphingobium sp.]